MVFKCRICGGSLELNQGEKLAVCEYCGVKQSLPTIIEPKMQEIYNKANDYLIRNEFDKAETLFNQVLRNDNSNADAYWSVLMCRYGITYVKDPSSGKYLPTCNRTLYTSIYNDENYLKAIKYATEEQKQLFSQNAKSIDEIQKGIIEISTKEKPFDIFISYKETDIMGVRTKDSIKAQVLYDNLVAEGYKVFFSRITLEDKYGTEYEPYIYAALASSKVMITVCSSKDNIESVWVKNEWSRFLSFAENNSDKTLIPLCFDMEKTDLPADFSNLSIYNMDIEGFEQELIRGIKKLIPLPIMILERRKKRKKILKKICLASIACAIIGMVIAIPWLAKLPDYISATQLYYDKNYPEAAWAFDELGSYRNSKEMKEKAENSWRKSLAKMMDWVKYPNGMCYINKSGVAEVTDISATDALKGVKVDEHGKTVSVSSSHFYISPVYALHHDGYVDNVAENNSLADGTNWENIIQISNYFKSTNVALRSDGTMIYGRMEDDYSNPGDEWLKEVSKWTEITEFDSHVVLNIYEGRDCFVIGIKSDGTVCGVSEFQGLESALEEFKDVKKIAADLDNGYFVIAALTKNGTVVSYEDGKYEEVSASGAIDVEMLLDKQWNESGESRYLTEIWVLQKDGSVKRLCDNKVLLSDVVYMENIQGYIFFITKNGDVYMYDGTQLEKKKFKTCVYEEWTERMK